MARKLRLEFPGACYHVINRGNYRRDIFETERTKAAFVSCLFDACVKSRWLLHAFVIMRNHFHLALETPAGNLVAGMHWLLATFATRFNRFRDERGHLFQGRYKALLVEAGDPLALVCHYIHLNPVRAGIIDLAHLRAYRHSSYWHLERPASRPPFLCFQSALSGAGGLADTAAGRNCYAAYLGWQLREGPAGQSKAYANLSRGWALGSVGFKQALVQDHALVARTRAWESEGAREIREMEWAEQLAWALSAIARSEATCRTASKSAAWKLAVAAWMKQRTQASNGWLCARLTLGTTAAFSRNLTSFRRRNQSTDSTWRRLTSSSET